MEALFKYYATALQLGPQEFAERHRQLFFLKRPAQHVTLPEETLENEEELATRRMSDEVEPGVFREEGTMAAEWRVAPVVKLAGASPLGPVVVGRARNCDVVLPFSSVSKFHAHVFLQPDDPRTIQLTDVGSSNGTFLNGKRLAPEQRVTVQRHDKVRFGLLELELIDAVMLYAVLQST